MFRFCIFVALMTDALDTRNKDHTDQDSFVGHRICVMACTASCLLPLPYSRWCWRFCWRLPHLFPYDRVYRPVRYDIPDSTHTCWYLALLPFCYYSLPKEVRVFSTEIKNAETLVKQDFRTKLSTTTSSGGLILALQRAITTARPEGRYRKHCYWLRYKAVLLESSLLESSACSLIYFCTASSVILPIVST